MQVTMLTDTQATTSLVQLVRECVRFDVAVAWAGHNDVVNEMLNAHSKLGRVVIGTHMYHTDPKLLEHLMFYKGVRYLPPKGPLFHPKIYFFQMPTGLAAVVGSHNFTGGAFGGTNIEASVLLEGSRNDTVFADLTAFITSNWQAAKNIDNDFLFSYEIQYRKNKEKRNALCRYDHLKKPRVDATTSLMNASWETFITQVKSEDEHMLKGRLKILHRASALFEKYDSFSAMSQFQRKAIAGTYGSKEPQLGGLNWHSFGKMSGQGVFTNLVNNEPATLSDALQIIPREGEVLESEYKDFVHQFTLAFRNKSRTGGVPTASRLLAMKRPDVFVCVTDANRVGLCKTFGAAPTTLTLHNYWERIVIPMQNSPW